MRTDITIPMLHELVKVAREHIDPGRTLVCAGGAPRDILMGGPVKDIDLFFYDREASWLEDPLEGSEHTSLFYSRAAALGETLGLLLTTPEEPGMHPSDPGDGNLHDFVELGGRWQGGMITIQIMALGGCPIDDMANYDFAASQVAVTPTIVVATSAALYDHAGNRITYLAPPQHATNPASKARSIARLARLRAKYTGVVFANCEALSVPELGDEFDAQEDQ